VGSDGPFGEHAEPPTDLGDSDSGGRPAKAGCKPQYRNPKKISSRQADKAAERKDALAYEHEQKLRDCERAREEAARQKERERQGRVIRKTQSVAFGL
jgi:hypothetical protein